MERDPLTGLPGQREFAAQLQAAIRQARTEGVNRSLMLIDIDGRQNIVQRHGSQAGDQALREIARRLEGMLKKSEMLARLGEDEFAVISEGRPDRHAHGEATRLLAERMVFNVCQPVAANDGQLHFRANIGIALCRSDPASPDVLQEAAAALRRAKAGPPGIELAAREAPASPAADWLERELPYALEAAEIGPFFQPVVDLAARRVRGFEALARWHHPCFGAVPPDTFIPVLERLGLMPQLTSAILAAACREARHWPEPVHVAVNVSPSELSDPALASRILRIAAREGLAPARLVIEITETAAVQDSAAAKATIHALRKAGVITAMDDFGTGYSSLRQLRELQCDWLKIDRGFVQPMLENPDCEKIVQAVIGLARSLNMRVVAEGIETAPAAARLAAQGCDFGQGFHFGRPMSGREAAALLKSGLLVTAAA